MNKRAFNAVMQQIQQNYPGYAQRVQQSYGPRRQRIMDHDDYNAADIFLNPRHANPAIGQDGLRSKILAGWSALRGGPTGQRSVGTTNRMGTSWMGALGGLAGIKPNKPSGT